MISPHSKLQMLKVQKRDMFRPAYKCVKTDEIASLLEGQGGRLLAGLSACCVASLCIHKRAAFQIEHIIIADICAAVLGNVLTL